MDSALRITTPKDINFTLEITMTLGEWIALKEQLSDKYPAWRLSREISYMISLADAKFHPGE